MTTIITPKKYKVGDKIVVYGIKYTVRSQTIAPRSKNDGKPMYLTKCVRRK